MSLPDGYATSFSPGGTDEKTARETPTPRTTFRRSLAVPYSQIHRERVEWLVPGRIPLGALSILAGEPGLGKSMYSIRLAASLSQQGHASIVLSAEDAEGATIRPRLDACGADGNLINAVHLVEGDEGDGLALPADAGELDQLIAETGARLVVVDPIVAYLDGGIDSHKDASVRQALAPLSRIAAARSCAILAILHVNKALGSDWYRRLSGSGGFGAAARSVLLFGRDPDDEDPERGRGRLLAHAKCNVAELAASERWTVASILLSETGDDPETRTARLELVGESEHSVRSLLDSSSDPEERLPRDEAREFLLAELAGGEVPTKDLQRMSRDAGLAWRTVQRAARALGIKTRPSDFGKHWVWSLPQSAPRPSAQSVGHPEWRTSRKPHEQTGSGISNGSGSHSVSHTLDVAHSDQTGGARGCSHQAFWLARDEIRRCVVCDPPAFSSEIVARPHLPLPIGRPGYLHRLSVAKEADHVTEGEWARLKLVHQELARRSA